MHLVRRSTSVLVLAIFLVLSAGCKKNPTLVNVTAESSLKSYEVTVMIAGKVVELDEKHLRGYANFKPGTAPAVITADVTYATPCGKKTFTITAPNPPYKGKYEDTVSIDITARNLPGRTRLWLPPGIEGVLKIGELQLPKPLPKELFVTFGDCPRMVNVDGVDTAIPEVSAGRGVLVARSARSCYRDGEVRFGSDPSCRPDSSKRLTGQPTYVLDGWREYFFEGVPTTTKVRGKCSNSTYLQTCS